MSEGDEDAPRGRPSRPSGDAPARGSEGPPRSRASAAPQPPEEHDLGDATEVAPSAPSGGSSSAGRSRPDSVAERAARRREKDPRVGQVLLGRYRLEKAIAKGGMGRVYLATQLQLGRSVAVKILNAEFKETDPQFVRRFGIEAAISAKLSHPNVVTIHDYGESEGGELFMAMELLRGKTLSHIVQKEAPFPAARTIHIALQIARALRDAHALGVIHRDLKPGNVMLISAGDDADFVKVLDFGLVKLFVPEGQAMGLPERDEEDLTRAGTLLGSPRYMSPEQIRGLPLDPRTDIYSFGVLMFQMAAGRPPFTGSGSVDLIYKHIHEAPPRVSEVTHADCPPELEGLIARCLEKDRDRRFASMGEVISALKEARQSITGVIVRPNAETGPVESLGKEATTDRALSALSDPPRADEPTGSQPRAALAEAAFSEPPGPSGPIAADPSSSVAMPRPRRTPLVVGAVMFGAGALLLAALALAPRPTPIAPAPDPAPPSSAAPRRFSVSLSSEPSGATVREGDAILGVTPVTLELEPSSAPRHLRATLEGHADAEKELTIDGPTSVAFSLEALPAPEPSASADPSEEPAPSPTKKRPTAKRPAKRPKPSPYEEEGTEDEDKRPARYRNNPY